MAVVWQGPSGSDAASESLLHRLGFPGQKCMVAADRWRTHRCGRLETAALAFPYLAHRRHRHATPRHHGALHATRARGHHHQRTPRSVRRRADVTTDICHGSIAPARRRRRCRRPCLPSSQDWSGALVPTRRPTPLRIADDSTGQTPQLHQPPAFRPPARPPATQW